MLVADKHTEVESCKRRISELENQLGVSKSRSRKRRKGNNGDAAEDEDPDSHSDDSDDELEDETAAVRRLGKLCFLTVGLWFRAGFEGLFTAVIDDDFQERERFETKRNKIQGEIREVRALIPEKYEARSLTPWFRKQVTLLLIRWLLI